MILGVVLAPTDAALGQAVVTEPRVPPRIRQGLNVESGLNDGICVPLLFAAVALADVESEIADGRSAATLLVEEIGYGVVGGHRRRGPGRADRHPRGPPRPDRRRLAPGHPGRRRGARLRHRRARSAAPASSRRSSPAWPSGWCSGATPEDINELSEQVGNVLNGVTFVLFGAILLGPALGELTWEVVALRGAEPDGGADGAGRDRDARHARASADARVHGLVRPAGPRLDRLRGDRGRGGEPPARAPDRAGDLPHRRALGPGPRAHRGAARGPLRALVRAAPARRRPADGERRGRGHAIARAGPPTLAHRRSRPDRSGRPTGGPGSGP